MRKGHISLILCDFAYIMNFLRFQGEPSGFTRKNSILGGLRRKLEIRGSPGHQETRHCAKTGDARPCIKAHGRAPKEHEKRRPPVKWHGHPVPGGMAVPPRTGGRAPHARPCVGWCRAYKWLFAISFWDFFWIPPLFPCFSSLL